METKSLKLDKIDIASGTQMRVNTNSDVVNNYAEILAEGGNLPAIDVFFDGAKYYLADGFHRYFAAKQNEYKDILANIREGTLNDAIKFALKSNSSHGLPRTNQDKRNIVNIALERFADWSDRKIADHCSVSNTMVSTRRNEIDAAKAEEEAKLAAANEPEQEKPRVTSGEQPELLADAPKVKATPKPAKKRQGKDGKVRTVIEKQKPAPIKKEEVKKTDAFAALKENMDVVIEDLREVLRNPEKASITEAAKNMEKVSRQMMKFSKAM